MSLEWNDIGEGKDLSHIKWRVYFVQGKKYNICLEFKNTNKDTFLCKLISYLELDSMRFRRDYLLYSIKNELSLLDVEADDADIEEIYSKIVELFMVVKEEIGEEK